MALVVTDLSTGDVYNGMDLTSDIQNGFGSVLLDGSVVFEVENVTTFEELEQIFLSEFQVTQV
jgi:hypothetical protein